MSTVLSTNTITLSRTNWIISKRSDLLWFIGGPLAGYVALALAMLTPESVFVPFMLVWAWGIQGPHFFATALRTYLNREERRKRKWLLLLIIPACLLPIPVVIILGQKWFIVLSILWGTFHISKQHLGIVMLFKRKNHETDKRDMQADKTFLLVSQFLPLVLFLMVYMGVPGVRVATFVGLTAQSLLLVAYLLHQRAKWRANSEMNWPKLALLAAVIPLHWLAVACAAVRPPSALVSALVVFTIGTNIGHALQYHRLSWFHNHNRYNMANGYNRFGLVALLSRRAIVYYLAALALSLAYRFLPDFIDFSYRDLVLAGPIFMHYLLDARIWRVRGDQELAAALHL
jgi:hypothetical protein